MRLPGLGVVGGPARVIAGGATELERAQREGDVDPDTDAAEVARAVLAAQLGVVALGRTGMDVAALTEVARSALARLLPAPAP